MGLTDSHSIEKEIDSYFMTKGASDFNIYKDSFTQRCASLIWESFCRHYDFSHRYGNAAKNVNDFIEALKEFPYSDTIHIETINTDPHVYLVQLKNGKWYLHEGSWYYFAVPLWNEMPRYLPYNIDIHDEAELMLAFDEYIPQIQVRAGEMKASVNCMISSNVSPVAEEMMVWSISAALRFLATSARPSVSLLTTPSAIASCFA